MAYLPLPIYDALTFCQTNRCEVSTLCYKFNGTLTTLGWR